MMMTSQWIVTDTGNGNGDCRITCPDCGGHGWTGQDVPWPEWRPEPIRHAVDCPRNVTTNAQGA